MVNKTKKQVFKTTLVSRRKRVVVRTVDFERLISRSVTEIFEYPRVKAPKWQGS